VIDYRRYALRLLLLILVVASLPACFGGGSNDHRGVVYPKGVSDGLASWYGPGFHGKRTASGERFNENHLTAAHKTLPFGTVVRVTNLVNGRRVDVRINDRGPFVRGRVIDLSKAAAREVDMIRDGVVPVNLQIIQFAGD
jgi:rare lipoprotein A